jgi:hypothetical protein
MAVSGFSPSCAAMSRGESRRIAANTLYRGPRTARHALAPISWRG